jgi:hypothetical protein
VVRGKRLMETVWQLDVEPWESLVEEEFIG